MIKTPNNRRGMEALRYWALAGAIMPEPSACLSYEWTEQSLVITAVELELPKGRTSIALPPPALSANVLLMAEVAGELYEAFPSASIAMRVFGRDALKAAKAPTLVLTSKEATTYTGPLSHYYLLSDR